MKNLQQDGLARREIQAAWLLLALMLTASGLTLAERLTKTVAIGPRQLLLIWAGVASCLVLYVLAVVVMNSQPPAPRFSRALVSRVRDARRASRTPVSTPLGGEAVVVGAFVHTPAKAKGPRMDGCSNCTFPSER